MTDMERKSGKQAANNSASARLIKRARKGEILEMLLAGVPYTDIRRKCAIDYNKSLRTIEVYIAEVRSELPDMFKWGERRLMVSEAVGKAEKLYARAIAKNNLKVALDTLRWIGDLQGLTAAQRIADEIAKGGEMSLRQFNEARGCFGKPPMTEEEFEDYKRGHMGRN